MAGIRIEGNTSGAVAEVTSTDELRVSLTDLEPDTAGFAAILGEVDAGTVTGTRTVRAPEVSKDFRLRVGVDTRLFSENFAGSALNSAVWTAPVTTQTVAVANGLVTLNNSAITTINTVSRVSSYRSFPCYGTFGLAFECTALLTQLPLANATTEWGLGIATGSAAPTDGAFFRYNASGELRCVLSAGGSEQTSIALSAATLIGVSTSRHFIITLDEDGASYWIDDVLVSRLPRLTSEGFGTRQHELPILLRQIDGAIAPSAATQLRVGWVGISVLDSGADRSIQVIAAGSGRHSSQGQTGGTMGSTASYANSADPAAAAAISNTTPPVQGLGGQVRVLAPVAGTTDGILTSYTVPAGSVTVPGQSLFVSGVWIDAVNLVAAVATTATTLQVVLCYGHTADSLATAEAATTKAPRRIPLGVLHWAVGAVVGAPASGGGIRIQFASPVCVQPGERIAVSAKALSGTATATEEFRFSIGFDGWFE